MAEEYSRPNPDELLARVKAEEDKARRGKLKIFLGYIPGVGKTYTMLEAAHQVKKDVDVVVAYVDTHGRVDTEALAEGAGDYPPQTGGIPWHCVDGDGPGYRISPSPQAGIS